MTAWIFQSDPTEFDLDGYLASTPEAITWLVGDSSNEINTGDTVYLWRRQSSNNANARSGLIASAKVLQSAETIPNDPNAAPFWKKVRPPSSAAESQVTLEIARTGNKREMLRSEWLKDDPLLRGMRIFSTPKNPISQLTPEEESRLAKMWARVGQDWNREESLAGLWAYVQTHGITVSKKGGSPVEIASQRSGRAITGVYNKVMNFRAIDPRDLRAGMSGAAKADKLLWAEFFDEQTNTLNEQGIRDEFTRVWEQSALPTGLTDFRAANETFDGEVRNLASRTLKELEAAYLRKEKRSTANRSSSRPATKLSTVTLFEREPLVVAIGKVRANFQCESEDCKHELFVGNDDRNYCEVHHIEPLAKGGADVIENVVCLCPAHHREAHLGKNALKLKIYFQSLRAQVGQ